MSLYGNTSLNNATREFLEKGKPTRQESNIDSGAGIMGKMDNSRDPLQTHEVSEETELHRLSSLNQIYGPLKHVPNST